MGANKSDIYRSDIKKYHCNQAIIIAPDIENVPVVPNCVNAIKNFLHFVILAQSAIVVSLYQLFNASSASL